MKKFKQILFLVLFFLALKSNAQLIEVSTIGNLLFPISSPTWTNISQTATNAYSVKGKNNLGFNIGVSFKINTPTSFFIMPELYYTSFKDTYTNTTNNISLEAKSNRIDLPLMLGANLMFKKICFYAGPVASYNMSTKDKINNFVQNAEKDFTIGYQFGAQGRIGSLVINGRFEGAFSKDIRTFISYATSSTGTTIRYDNRPSFLILGVGYRF